jgi:hypothetical protein
MGSPTASGGLSLSALLSQVLVSFTIEFDNEFEHQMPHRTTNHPSSSPSRQGPWLVSLVMWSNCMRFVDEKGVAVREVERLVRTQTNWSGMERWGYIIVRPDETGPRPKAPRSEWMVRPTAKGRLAQQIWRALFGAIEVRWGVRLGVAGITGPELSVGSDPADRHGIARLPSYPGLRSVQQSAGRTRT